MDIEQLMISWIRNISSFDALHLHIKSSRNKLCELIIDIKSIKIKKKIALGQLLQGKRFVFRGYYSIMT